MSQNLMNACSTCWEHTAIVLHMSSTPLKLNLPSRLAGTVLPVLHKTDPWPPEPCHILNNNNTVHRDVIHCYVTPANDCNGTEAHAAFPDDCYNRV